MREARELCNLSQSAAAGRLGYQNSSKLSKVEGATDTRSIPLWLIVRAAKVYEVSFDFLFGSSDPWDTSPRMSQEREISAWMFDAWEKARRNDLQTLRALHDKVEEMDASIRVMLEEAGTAEQALERFVSVNPEFEDMRASNRLAISVARAAGAAKNAQAKMARFRCSCKAASVSTQLSLSI